MSELRTALVIVWLVLSFALITAVLAPFLLSPETISSLVPACEARQRGATCVLCGMTTAYVRLTGFDFAGALDANRLSVALWTGSILNFAVAKAYILFRLVQHAGRRN